MEKSLPIKKAKTVRSLISPPPILPDEISDVTIRRIKTIPAIKRLPFKLLIKKRE